MLSQPVNFEIKNTALRSQSQPLWQNPWLISLKINNVVQPFSEDKKIICFTGEEQKCNHFFCSSAIAHWPRGSGALELAQYSTIIIWETDFLDLHAEALNFLQKWAKTALKPKTRETYCIFWFYVLSQRIWERDWQRINDKVTKVNTWIFLNRQYEKMQFSAI